MRIKLDGEFWSDMLKAVIVMIVVFIVLYLVGLVQPSPEVTSYGIHHLKVQPTSH